MLTGQRFTSPDGYAAHLGEHGCELARAPSGALYVRQRPPKHQAAAAVPEKKTKKQKAIDLEARHAMRSMRQRGEFRFAPAQLVADVVGVTRRTIERWRKAYENEVIVAVLVKRLDARRR